jgi:hypothetical protein
MARSLSSYGRPGARLKQSPTVLILCEDSKSSQTYLREAALHYRAYAKIELADTRWTDPVGIVREAISRNRRFDAIYCAIDRDTHHNFDEAVALAAGFGVNLIVSYPCYEFWLILHFKRTRRPHSSVGSKSAADRATDELRKQDGMGGYAKGDCKGLFEKLYSRLPVARANADWALEQAETAGSLDPSTRIHNLISLFETLGNESLA